MRLSTAAILLALFLAAAGGGVEAQTANDTLTTHLDLSRRRLRAVPPEVYTMTNLRHLNLSHNRLDSLDERLLLLTRLDTLLLGRNRLRHVPEWIGNMRSLRLLDMSRNPILDLPPSMANLTRLERLVLWSTGVVSVPQEMGALNYTLKELDLRVCPMTYDDQKAVEEILPTPRKRWDHVCNCK
ncbi:MAG: leucine-rich repeat domain-containing protein [Bacteroidales bacterium]|nr:leucine-rich repeat domain-containing protein [Bacteroidales bacterium]